MSLIEKAVKEFESKMKSGEQIKGTITTYYESENGFSGLAGVPNGNPTPIRGILAYTNKSLMFYGEIFTKIPISLHIPFREIKEIKKGKQIFAIFKSSPTIVVIHSEREIFSTRGNKDEFTKLEAFFKNINELQLN
jgi:hypothetical protein